MNYLQGDAGAARRLPGEAPGSDAQKILLKRSPLNPFQAGSKANTEFKSVDDFLTSSPSKGTRQVADQMPRHPRRHFKQDPRSAVAAETSQHGSPVLAVRSHHAPRLHPVARDTISESATTTTRRQRYRLAVMVCYDKQSKTSHKVSTQRARPHQIAPATGLISATPATRRRAARDDLLRQRRGAKAQLRKTPNALLRHDAKSQVTRMCTASANIKHSGGGALTQHSTDQRGRAKMKA